MSKCFVRRPWRTCGRSSERQTPPSRKRSECRRRNLIGRCRWRPSRGGSQAEPSCLPGSDPGPLTLSSCVFSHKLASFCVVWRVEGLYGQHWVGRSFWKKLKGAKQTLRNGSSQQRHQQELKLGNCKVAVEWNFILFPIYQHIKKSTDFCLVSVCTIVYEHTLTLGCLGSEQEVFQSSLVLRIQSGAGRFGA